MSQFDWTNILILALGIAVAALEEVFRRKLVPFLKEKKLMNAAQIAVDLAEALIGRGEGQRKLKIALQNLQEKGYSIDEQAVLDAVQEVWRRLDLRMIEEGKKEAPLA